jgi:hypothetical protein
LRNGDLILIFESILVIIFTSLKKSYPLLVVAP